MIYAYDLLINLNEVLYDFYDWQENDDLMHIRRVPLFKVDDKSYNDFIFKKVRISDDALNLIKDKTQVFTSKSLVILNYAMIITNGENALLLEFDSQGFVNRKSKFLVNEELEVVELSESMKTTEITYNVISKKCIQNAMIRSEKKTLDKILSELYLIKDDKEKIDYLYYEWFGEEVCTNKYEKLTESLKNRFTERHEEFLETLELLALQK